MLYRSIMLLCFCLALPPTSLAAETLLWPASGTPADHSPYLPGKSLIGSGALGNVLVLNTEDTSLDPPTLDGSVAGALARVFYAAPATRNTVIVGRVHITHNAHGAWAEQHIVEGNTLLLAGGRVAGRAEGAFSRQGAVEGNSLHMTAGQAATIAGGTSVQGTASNNVLTMSGGTAEQVMGGHSEKGEANGNKITMSGGTAAQVVGGMTRHADAKGNRIALQGGSITASVIGGHSLAGPRATHNTVDVHAGMTLDAGVAVYGGWRGDAPGAGTTPTTKTAQAPQASGAGTTPTTKTAPADAGNPLAGNVLNFLGFSGTLRHVGNFQYITLTLPAAVKGGDVLLRIAEAVDLRGVSLRVTGLSDPNTPLQKGDSITLVQAPALLTDASTTLPTATLRVNGKPRYELRLDWDNAQKPTAVMATVVKVL